jgi:hypothetical protein
MTIRFEVHGLQGAISTLRKYDREMYQTIITDLKLQSAPLVAKVAAEFPNEPFRRVNNWHSEGGRKGKSRMPAYNVSKVRGGVKPAIYSASAKVGREQGIYRLNQNDAGGAYMTVQVATRSQRLLKTLTSLIQLKQKGTTSIVLV